MTEVQTVLDSRVPRGDFIVISFRLKEIRLCDDRRLRLHPAQRWPTTAIRLLSFGVKRQVATEAVWKHYERWLFPASRSGSTLEFDVAKWVLRPKPS